MWAAQSDQSLHCPHEKTFGPYLPIERTAKTLISLGLSLRWRTLILLVLSCRGSCDWDWKEDLRHVLLLFLVMSRDNSWRLIVLDAS